MRQFFLWLIVAFFAGWTSHAAYQLAAGWAYMVKRDGPWADKKKIPWPTGVSVQMLFVVLGLLSSIGLAAFATSDRWEKQLRKACKCDMMECHCTFDAELLYRRADGDAES